MGLGNLVSTARVDLPALTERLDAMSHAERLRALHGLGRRQMRRLFDAAGGYRQTTLGDAVPAGTPDGQVVLHQGWNSLPLFRVVAKPLVRFAAEIGGRNAILWDWFTGPGYFTVRVDGGELVFDYVHLPKRVPAGWPKVRSNSLGPSFFIYRGLSDRVRALSSHVTISHAWRNGKPTPHYFALTRRP